MLPTIKPYIIGETAFHHQGDKSYLIKLIDAAAELKLDAIKFHLLFDIDDYFVPTHPAIELSKEWNFPPKKWKEIFEHAKKKGLDIIALCNDEASFDWVNKECITMVRAVELHATGINDIFLLQKAVKFPGTVILGIGGSNLEQINFSIDFLKKNNKSDIFLMYGFQNYPTDYNDINFSKISLIQDLFKLPVGYADHTDPKDPNNEFIAASSLLKGINVIEKHFTINIEEERIDSQAAVSLEQMKNLKKLCNIMFLANGNGGLEMSEAEKKYGDTGPMKKAIVARTTMPKNHVIELEDLALKRTLNSSYIDQKDIISIVGLKTKKKINQDDIIDYSNVEYNFRMAETNQFFKNKK